MHFSRCEENYVVQIYQIWTQFSSQLRTCQHQLHWLIQHTLCLNRFGHPSSVWLREKTPELIISAIPVLYKYFMLNPGLESHQCLYTSIWIKMVWLSCWLPRGQQVLHQRWIWDIHCTQVMKHASEGRECYAIVYFTLSDESKNA